MKVAEERSATCPFSARIQPLRDTTTVTGSRSIIASARSATTTSGAASKVVRRRPSFVSGPNFFLTSRISTAIICHCFLSLARSDLDRGLLLGEVVLLLAQRHLLETAQASQAGVEDVDGLQLGQAEADLQRLLRLLVLANDADHLVEIEKDDDHAGEELEPLVDRRQPVTRAADQHRAAVVEPLPSASPSDTTLGVTPSTSTFMLTEIRVSSSVSRNRDSISVSGSTARVRGSSTIRTSSVEFVAHVGEQRQLALVEQVRDLFDQPRLLDPVGNLADDRDPAAAAGILLRPARAQTEGAATGAVGVDDRGLGVDDDAAGREVRTRHELGHRFGVGARMGDEVERRVAEFGDVVRRDRGRHADRDALRAVGEQVRNRGRHDDRLLGVAGVVVAPVDRIFLDALHEETGDVGHPRLGVAVGGGVVAVDVAEIALPLDQRVARGEILRQAHQGLVDRLIAMRMERPHHVADDLGAFLEG